MNDKKKKYLYNVTAHNCGKKIGEFVAIATNVEAAKRKVKAIRPDLEMITMTVFILDKTLKLRGAVEL